MNSRLIPRSRVRPRRAGLTLIEIVIVVIVIGILAAILLPAIGSVRESAHRITCMNQMRQLGLGLQNYESRHSRFPPAKTTEKNRESIEPLQPDGADKCPEGWEKKDGRCVPKDWEYDADSGVCCPEDGEYDEEEEVCKVPWIHNALMFILPYLELDYISDKIDMTKSWNKGANEDIAKQHVYLFLCPSAPYRDPANNYDATDYTVAYKIDPGTLYNDLKAIGYGVDMGSPQYTDAVKDREKSALEQGLLGEDTFNTHSQISDGLGNTFMMVERAGHPYMYEDGKYTKVYKNNMRWAGSRAAFSIDEMHYDPTEGEGMETGWKIMNRKNSQEIYSFHPGGAVFLYGDGAARFESESMDPVTFANLFTRDGGEVEFRE